MSRPIERLLVPAGAVAAGLLGIAFLAAPRSCEGGLELYFGAGIVAVVALGALPFFLLRGATPGARVGGALALAALGAVAWLVGLFAADVRIVCRLF